MTRLSPAARAMSNVKQSPDICPKRPLPRRKRRDAVLEVVLQLRSVDSERRGDVPERQHPEHLATRDRDRPRRRGTAGRSRRCGGHAAGHVRSARRPPEFVIANWSLSHTRPHRVGDDVAARATRRPPVDRRAAQASARGTRLRRFPDLHVEDRRQLRVECVDLRLDLGVGRDAVVHGLWKSAVM